MEEKCRFISETEYHEYKNLKRIMNPLLSMYPWIADGDPVEILAKPSYSDDYKVCEFAIKVFLKGKENDKN